MKHLIPILRPILLNSLATKHSAKKNMTGMGLWMIAAGLGIVGFVFLALSGFIWLQGFYSRESAALLIAAGILAMAVIAAMVGQQKFQEKAIQEERQVEEVQRLVNNTLDMVGDELDHTIQRNPKTAILVSSIAGIIAGRMR